MSIRSVDGISPLGDGNASTRLWAPSRLAHEQSKSSVVGLSLLGVSTMLFGLLLLEPLIFAHSADEIILTQRQ